MSRDLPLPTRDPFGPGALVVTALESPTTGVAITGRFSLGWVGRLTPEQLDLIGLLLARRNNLQQVAADVGVAYNTLRARFDDIVDAVNTEDRPARGVPGAVQPPPPPPVPPVPPTPPTPGRPGARRRSTAETTDVLRRLANGEIDTDQAASELRRPG